MIPDFSVNRPYIEHEFEHANFDPASGLDAAALEAAVVGFFESHDALPPPIRRARTYEFLLENAQIEINPHQIFADKINIGVNFDGFASSDLYQRGVFERQRARVLERELPEDFARAKQMAQLGIGSPWVDFWHTVPDWRNVLKWGFVGFVREAEAAKARMLASDECTPEKLEFYDSVIICHSAMIAFVKRLHAASLAYGMPEYTACLAALTERAPETMYEVLEFVSLYTYLYEIGTERARSLGPVDRLYYPYYQADLESGRCTKEEIAELLRYFFIRWTAAKRFAEQPITLGGADAAGNTYANDLTRLMLDVYDEMNIFNPKLHVRVHAGLPDDIFTKLLDMIRRGNSSICLMNDETVTKGLVRTGISPEDAADYVVLGCYEPIVMGKEEAQIANAWLNLAKPLEFALNGGCDMLTGRQFGEELPLDYADFDSFFAAYLRKVDEILDFTIDFVLAQDKFSREINPTPFYSATMNRCMERGMDVHEHPLEYNNMSLKCYALATVVDSLTAVKKYVFEKKLVSLPALREILKNDWDGEEKLRRTVIADNEKYGNNLDVPDSIMCAIITHITDRLDAADTKRGGKFRLGLDSINNNVHGGANTAATPDGRHARRPLSRNLCAAPGMDRRGITALMNSLLKLDHVKLVDSGILDFMLHPTAVAGDEGLAAFKSLIRTYFARGGFAAQGNIASRETLVAAKASPEEYSTLQIRVCGWNEYFVRMNPKMQDVFISELTQMEEP